MTTLTTTKPTTFLNVKEVRIANNSIGHHWFTPASMRFFNSQVTGSDKLINKRFFISSEQFDFNSDRMFTIRLVKPNGEVETYGEFQAYKTKKEAITAARKITV